MSSTGVTLYQANAITEGRYQFDLIEKRIIYFIIAECREKYIESDTGQRDLFNDLIITISGEQLRKADTNMKRVYQSAKALRKKDIEVNDANTWMDVGFITYTKHYKKDDQFEIGVSKEILPYLVELTGRFTTYQLAVAITLKSTYTQRFYELCSQWKNKGYFYMNLEKLRRMLKCEDKFKTFGEFRRGVIEVSQKELKDAYEQGVCDLWFEWKPLEKKGKKVLSVEFMVKTKENSGKKVYTIDDYIYFIRTTISARFPKNKPFQERVLDACRNDFETAEKIAEKLMKKINEYSASEQAGIIKFVLKADFGIE
jgi:plasmid replication initiation protein